MIKETKILISQKRRKPMSDPIMWNNRFNIGVESIDKAHQKLFSIVHKIINLNDSEKDRQWIGEEGIKYFKNYAIKHFADEEAYMQSIGYSGYATHKRIHDNMKNNTLPALESDMIDSEYSVESVQHFLGICIGWLTSHIMLDDCAITGKVTNKWIHEWTEDANILKNTVIQVMKELFGLDMETVSEHYAGDDFGQKFCYRLTYCDKTGKRTQVFFIFEKSLIFYFVNHLIGVKLTRIDKVVIDATAQIAQQFMKRVAMYYKVPGMNRLEKNNLLTDEQFTKDFSIAYPRYSMLFNTGKGYFAFCVKN